MKGFFVTGTDTEVGKTRISVALIELLQQQGKIVAGMKPIASGCEHRLEGLRNGDAEALIKQANITLPYDVINPYAFEPAIAPHIAAEQAGITIDLEHIKQCYQDIQKQVDAVVVEGAGGWLVPLNKQHTMADLAVQLDLPVVLVIAIRLGCINHALLTVQAIQQSGLPFHGWVANQIEPNTQSEAIITSLKNHISAPCLGIVPTLTTQQTPAIFLTV